MVWWKERLTIQDWRVNLVFKRAWDMSDNANLGSCDAMVSRKSATILLMDPIDASQQGDDSEETLVHELLHLHTAGFHNTDDGKLTGPRRTAMEQMVDLLSIALVRLRRESVKARLEGLHEGLGKNIDTITAALASLEKPKRKPRKKS